ncbi:MAG: R3H domain-containing nucleic acid-binding protein [Patescibacteria group bacterium]|jgi:spoIIIJ-associated protein
MEELILKIKDNSKNLLDLMGFDADPIVTFKDNIVFMNFNLESPALLIGKGGEGLESFQHILRSIMGKEIAQHNKSLVIDIDGYRDKRIEGTKKHAREKAFQVLATGISEELSPMSSYERRIVHMVVSNIADVESESIGTGQDRRIVIKPKKSNKQ